MTKLHAIPADTGGDYGDERQMIFIESGSSGGPLDSGSGIGTPADNTGVHSASYHSASGISSEAQTPSRSQRSFPLHGTPNMTLLSIN